MDFEQARFNMIEQQIRPWDVLDLDVLALLAIVKREDFVPAAQRALAFMDVELPLGGGRSMLAPRVEARLLQELHVQRHEHVLEIGAGSGYMAALLGHKAQRVIAMEIDPALAKQAAANLARAGAKNVEVREGDGAAGLPGEGPFDVILLSGSVQSVPLALVAQLKTGGRLVAVVGDEPMMRAMLYTKTADGLAERVLFDTVAPRLQGFGQRSEFAF
ncbi:MAG TPA: protein-L-isoaspartate O-methyltransferase [Burkholderiaceae bacterium]